MDIASQWLTGVGWDGKQDSEGKTRKPRFHVWFSLSFKSLRYLVTQVIRQYTIHFEYNKKFTRDNQHKNILAVTQTHG